jgi:exosome complex component CSL4
MKKDSNLVLPGDEIATIEEFLSSNNTYEYDGSIRSTRIGKVLYDIKSKIVRVNAIKSIQMPNRGDYILGFVHALVTNTASIRVLCINDVKSDARFDAIYISRGKIKANSMFRIGDIVRARVASLINGYIHITFKDDNLGVIYTRCSSCGGEVVKISNEEVKCIECNLISTRKLAGDYGNISALKLC